MWSFNEQNEIYLLLFADLIYIGEMCIKNLDNELV